MKNVNEFRWSLYARLWEEFYHPFESEWVKVQNALETSGASGDFKSFASFCESTNFEAVGSRALNQLSDVSLADSSFPFKVDLDLQSILKDYLRLLQPIVNVSRKIVIAAQEARHANLPDGSWNHTLGQIRDGAVAGYGTSFVADFIAPGSGLVGGLVGGIAGWWQGSQEQEKVDSHVNDLISRLSEMEEAIFDSFLEIWDAISRMVRSKLNLDLGGATKIIDAKVRWDKLVESLPDEESDKAFVKQLEQEVNSFVGHSGPYPEVVSSMVRFFLSKDSHDLKKAVEWSRIQCRLFACYAETYHNAVTIMLEANKPDKALKYVAAGAKKFPDDLLLRLMNVEAHAAAGKLREAAQLAERELRDDSDCEAYFYHARGLVRSEQSAHAAKIIKKWMAADRVPAAIGLAVRSDVHLRKLIDHEFLNLPEGMDADIRGVLEKFLHPYLQEPRHFFGQIDPETRQNALVSFVKLRHKERILFLWDWSLLGNGKSGLAITNQRLMWKAWLEEPVRFPFAELSANDIHGSDTSLIVEDNEVDLEDENKAELFADALRDIARISQS